MKGRGFTGRHMTAILVVFFGVVIAVNFTMARYARATFGGLVVENSYVASQEFNQWLDEAEAGDALGWDAVTAWRPDGRLLVTVSGPGSAAAVAAIARHPLGRIPDRRLAFEPMGKGRFLSRETLPDGRWTLNLAVTSAGKTWRRVETLQ
jgi:nitrogen fixation protein FixH